jgi:hypothetical protein
MDVLNDDALKQYQADLRAQADAKRHATSTTMGKEQTIIVTLSRRGRDS